MLRLCTTKEVVKKLLCLKKVFFLQRLEGTLKTKQLFCWNIFLRHFIISLLPACVPRSRNLPLWTSLQIWCFQRGKTSTIALYLQLAKIIAKTLGKHVLQDFFGLKNTIMKKKLRKQCEIFSTKKYQLSIYTITQNLNQTNILLKILLTRNYFYEGKCWPARCALNPFISPVYPRSCSWPCRAEIAAGPEPCWRLEMHSLNFFFKKMWELYFGRFHLKTLWRTKRVSFSLAVPQPTQVAAWLMNVFGDMGESRCWLSAKKIFLKDRRCSLFGGRARNDEMSSLPISHNGTEKCPKTNSNFFVVLIVSASSTR